MIDIEVEGPDLPAQATEDLDRYVRVLRTKLRSVLQGLLRRRRSAAWPWLTGYSASRFGARIRDQRLLVTNTAYYARAVNESPKHYQAIERSIEQLWPRAIAEVERLSGRDLT